MSIEHRNIPDAERHEPKGISTAANKEIYIANGAGSGSWDLVSSASLLGLAGDGGNVDWEVLTDGANGFKIKRRFAYGVMAVSNNNVGFNVPAAVDPTLQLTTDYVPYTGVGAPLASESLFGVTFNTDRLIVPVNGVYEFRAWCNISAFPNINAKIGGRFRVNGVALSPRTAIIKSNAAGDFGFFSAFGFVQLNANDYVQLMVASTHAGSLTIQNLNCTLDLKRAL